METIKDDLAIRLEAINTKDIYDVLSRIFVPFENNLGISTHMELFAAGIESVKHYMDRFRENPEEFANLLHIPGLNDYNTLATFHLISGLGSAADRIREAIGFSNENVSVLQKMLIVIQKNKLAHMEKDLGIED